MTIHEYIQTLKDRVKNFQTYWIQGYFNLGEDEFPWSLSEGEWDAQYESWIGLEDPSAPVDATKEESQDAR